MRLTQLTLAAAILSAPAQAAPGPSVNQDKSAILAEFTGLLAIPNVATNVADIRRNADHIMSMMASAHWPRDCWREITPMSRRRSMANGSSPVPSEHLSSTRTTTASLSRPKTGNRPSRSNRNSIPTGLIAAASKSRSRLPTSRSTRNGVFMPVRRRTTNWASWRSSKRSAPSRPRESDRPTTSRSSSRVKRKWGRRTSSPCLPGIAMH